VAFVVIVFHPPADSLLPLALLRLLQLLAGFLGRLQLLLGILAQFLEILEGEKANLLPREVFQGLDQQLYFEIVLGADLGVGCGYLLGGLGGQRFLGNPHRIRGGGAQGASPAALEIRSPVADPGAQGLLLGVFFHSGVLAG